MAVKKQLPHHLKKKELVKFIYLLACPNAVCTKIRNQNIVDEQKETTTVYYKMRQNNQKAQIIASSISLSNTFEHSIANDISFQRSSSPSLSAVFVPSGE